MVNRKQLLIDMGKRIRAKRVELHLTQNQVAEMLDVSLNYYGTIERGNSGLALEKLVLLHEKLDIDITYILTGIKQSNMKISDIVDLCPKEKRYSMERLIDYAIRLASNQSDENTEFSIPKDTLKVAEDLGV